MIPLLIILGAVTLFGGGYYLGIRTGAEAKQRLANIASELESRIQSVGLDGRRVIDAVRKHLP